MPGRNVPGILFWLAAKEVTRKPECSNPPPTLRSANADSFAGGKSASLIGGET